MTISATREERIRLYSGMGRAYELLRRWDKALEAYENMLATAREVGDREIEWEALQHLGMLATDFSADPEADDETFRGVREKAEQEAAEDGTEGRRESAKSEAFEWSPSYALRQAEEALALARRMDRDDLIAPSLYALAILDAYANRWESALQKMSESRSLHATMGDWAMEGELLNLSAWGEAMLGRPSKAIRLGQERRSIARELGDRDFYMADLHGLVLALLEVGDYEEALSVAYEGVVAARSSGFSSRLYFNLLLLGDTCRTLFRLEEARTAYTEMTGAANFAQYHALTHSKLCTVAVLEEDWEEAHTQALEAAKLRADVILQFTDPFHRHSEIEALLWGGNEALAREELRLFTEATGDNRRFRIAHLRARAVLERWEDETGSSIEQLREAEALANEIGLPGELWQIRAALGEIHEERGEYEEARRAFTGSTKVLSQLRDRIGEEDLRAGFLAAPQVRRVLEEAERG